MTYTFFSPWSILDNFSFSLDHNSDSFNSLTTIWANATLKQLSWDFIIRGKMLTVVSSSAAILSIAFKGATTSFGNESRRSCEEEELRSHICRQFKMHIFFRSGILWHFSTNKVSIWTAEFFKVAEAFQCFSKANIAIREE